MCLMKTCWHNTENPSLKNNTEPVPLPNIINEEEEYKVKEVRNHRKQEHSTQFLVHWKKYSNKNNQWIPETVLPYTKEAIQDYWKSVLSQNL